MFGGAPFSLAVGVVLLSGSAAVAGTLFGKVLDAESLNPVPGASIIVQKTNRGATTDIEGGYQIGPLPSGTYVLTVSSLGYHRTNSTAVVGVSDTVLLDFFLFPHTHEVEEITTTAARSYSAASSAFLCALDFELRPKQSAQDMLRMVPGLIIAQHAGGGKAEQIFLRGFDADHGTDVNLTVDGVPVNMVSRCTLPV